MQIFSDFPLKSLNTFGIVASAKEFVDAGTFEDIHEVVQRHKTGLQQMLVLGGGSNLLFTGDFNGLVVKISTRGKQIIEEEDEIVLLRVAAGEDWDDLVGYCVQNGWGGLENLSGIPGQVGSSPIQNIGAYGTELRDHFAFLEGINLCTGEIFEYDAERCQFGYRDSIFKRALKGRCIITHVVFRLQKKPCINLSYHALKSKFEQISDKEITIAMIREAVLEIRSAKLPDPVITGNAGSFFKNPVVSPEKLDELKTQYPTIVFYEIHSPGESGSDDLQPVHTGYKLAAGWLIEQCGWKGFRKGDAGVHSEQALVLVNYGNAKGMEILELAGQIQRSVREKFGVLLEREVNVI